MELGGTTCLVTGANRGIGLALTRQLARRRLRLLLAGVRDPAHPVAVEPAPDGAREVRTVRVDLSSPQSIAASCEGLGELVEGIDVLVNNAGRLTGGLLEEEDPEETYAMFQVNLCGLVDLTRRVLPGMLRRRRGMIVNNASISAFAHLPTAATYAASKAGVAAFSNALHRELRGTGVSTLLAITPAVTTDMLREVDARSGPYVDTSQWDRQTPDEWAGKVVRGVERQVRVIEPGGQTRALYVASHLPLKVVDGIAARMFTRPRRP